MSDDLFSGVPEAPGQVDVLVLGAGPAGLSAAWELARHGASVLVVEKESAPGGLCRTERREGFSFDQGGHRFITRDREVFDRVATLLGERLRVAERESVIRLRGREYHYPLRLGEVLRGEGALAILRILGGYAASRVASRPKTGGEGGFDGWVKREFGGAIYERFFEGYTEKLWGIPASRLSDDWAAERIPRLSLKEVAWRALGLPGRGPRTFARKYCYPRRGIGEIFEAVSEEVRRLGGKLLPGSRPLSLRPGSPVRAVITGPGGAQEVLCRQVISTIPLPDLTALLPAPSGVLAAAGGLRFRGLRFLNLLLDGSPVSEKTWIYVPEKSCLMTRIQVPARRSAENCPPGKTSLQLEIPGNPGDPLWEAPHHELLGRGLADLRSLGFEVASRLRGSFDLRAPHAYPVYERGYRERCREVLDWVDALPGISTAGRQGRFRYIFFDRAMREGIDAARRWLGIPTPPAGGEEDPLLPEESRSLVEALPVG